MALFGSNHIARRLNAGMNPFGLPVSRASFIYTAHRCPADVMSLGDLGEAHAVGAVTQNSLSVEVEWGAADVPAFELGAAHAGPYPLDD